MVVTFIVATSVQQSGVLVPTIPIFYSLKNKQNPETKSACPPKAVLGHTPTALALWPMQCLPVKDTVSSWEQDFMEDHFCHDAPDRPDVHYQTPGD